ncbi:MAG: hypothetical protein K9J12_05795 [Melioribacteraceae bacterium]|nr:hypothetical protein [Melioribacteraceae bacterium]MCF8264956.1 hypothetical protein [Melioribacteraceae bacterium]MCF8431972.1 hypothetical protein [Melioribacteraceae bacterium]
MLKLFLPAGNKSVVYFILYVVLITELLIVITERDELEEKEHAIRDKMIGSIAASYKQPVLLFIPVTESNHNIRSKEPSKTILQPLGLVSDEEKLNVQFRVDVAEESRRTPPNWPDGGITSDNGTDKYSIQKNNDGSAIFLADLTATGEYVFDVFFEVERVLPTYLTDELLIALAEELDLIEGASGGGHGSAATSLDEVTIKPLIAKSETEGFTVIAKVVGGVQKREATIQF